MNRLLTWALAATWLVVGTTSTASAQDQELVPDKIESKKREDGWYPKLVIGASFSFAHSSNVVGAQNGQTWNIGPAVDFQLDFYSGMHEWRTTIGIKEVFTRTPLIDEFVKTVDNLHLDSIYLLHIPSVPWLGPFARFSMDTSMFPSEDVRPSSSKYTITELDGTTRDVDSDRLDLTDAFAPMLLKQAVGMFAQPVDRDTVKLEFRVGVGAQEMFVQDGLGLTDDGATDAIEVKRLEDYQLVGAEVFAGVSGTITFEELGKDRPLVYGASAEVLFPFYSSIDQGKSKIELTTVDIQASLGIKLFSWMSLDYNFRALRQPLLVDEFQIQNNLLLNFSYALMK